MTRRHLARAILALVTAASILGATAPAANAAPHSGPNWTWQGPASWDAAYGTYGITVLGNAGATLDLGFSSTICASGATWEKSVKNYFKAARRQLRNSGWNLRAGNIGHPSGFSSTYRRQVLKGTNGAQGATTGVITLDYDFTTNVDGLSYCYQRSLAKYSNTSRWKGLRKKLTKVQNSLAYSGPGAPEGQDPDEF
jgi:hypothetical protein